MTIFELRKPVATFFLALLMVAQIGLIGQYLLMPKPAEAFFGVTWLDIPRIIEQVATAAAIRIGQSYAQKYLTRFIQQMTDKFKIKNFVYYDQYLSDYYLSNLILNNVNDPDLKQAADIMYRISISGEMGGYNNGGYCKGATASDPSVCAKAGGTWAGAVDPRQALVPKLKTAISNYYLSKGGVDPSKVYYPDSSMSDRDYFAMAQSYYTRPPSFTEQNINAQFGAYQSAATTASQAEILTGNQLKASRIVGGTCYTPDDPKKTSWGNGWDPVSCAKNGGAWDRSALDQARDVISNPAATLNNWISGGVQTLFNTSLNSQSPYAAIGSALGNFIFKKLELNGSSNGVINEYGKAYVGDAAYAPNPAHEIDLDGDGIPDGEDLNADGKLSNVLDSCYHGGVADQIPANDPNATSGCTPSGQAGASPYFKTFCSDIDSSITGLSDLAAFITRNRDQISGDGNTFKNEADVNLWTNYVLTAKTAIEGLADGIGGYHIVAWENMQISINRFAAYLNVVWTSLEEDKDLVLDGSWGQVEGADNLFMNSSKYHDYLVEVKSKIGKCNDPSAAAIAGITAPNIVTGPGAGSGAGLTCADVPTATACNVPNHGGLVDQIKSQLVSQGVNLSGNCGAFEITKRVAWALRAEGGGLLTTFHSGQCNGFASDIVAYPDNSAVDILGDSGGANIPGWNPGPASTEAGVNYSPAVDPGV